MDHTREGDSGFGPRLFVLILAGLSAWLNTLHAIYGGYPASSKPLWAAPPIVAVVIYEFTIRHLYRKQLRATGEIPSRITRFDRASWLLFPVKTYKALRVIVRHRRIVTVSLVTGQLFTEPGRESGANPGTLALNPGMFGANPGQLPAGTVPNPRDVRVWARRTGLRVGHTGPLPADVIARYLQAMTAGELEPPPPEPGDDDTEPESGGRVIELTQAPEIPEINGHEITGRRIDHGW
jgi:hypothetical protein